MRTDAAPVSAAVQWLRAHVPPGSDLREDSRRVRPGDAFLALPGRRSDGLRFIDDALARGAAAVLVDADRWHARVDADPPPVDLPPVDPPPVDPPPVPLLEVPQLAGCTGWIAADYYGDPTAQLHAIGITGTNGKTTTCQWVGQLLGLCGVRCATLGTLGFGFAGALDERESDLTTPDATTVQRLARAALDRGAQAFALEASSVGLDQGRLQGVSFDVAVFTNLTRDHLDYHGDMQAYGAAKRALFDWPTLSHAVINLDDAFGRELAAALCARGMTVTGITMASESAPASVTAGDGGAVLAGLARLLRAEAIEHRHEGMRFSLRCIDLGAATDAPIRVQTRVIGGFNVLNLLAALAAALACGVALKEAGAALEGLQAPAGRLQPVAPPQGPTSTAPGASALPQVIVDYAHTPDAIVQALAALRPLAQARGGRLWIVFGAGGDRDRGKRPAMAAAAGAADAIVLTSDNPRGEDPARIISDLAAAVAPQAACTAIVDRAAAIASAVDRAGAQDIILVAGKGHEPYQEIGGRRLPFSDAAVAAAALHARAGRPS
jgi:UDP-N-acetylmuramoyl-L-alanyl-D-glutamate--2,6-diaminopimelate ligase